mmetsp:Transcript_5806/g.13230  ORF Transcript_5806/g.13230 Transcript_5806/m.13230 type:complete len:231 (-) Transcript_5806:468-1160(-)
MTCRGRSPVVPSSLPAAPGLSPTSVRIAALPSRPPRGDDAARCSAVLGPDRPSARSPSSSSRAWPGCTALARRKSWGWHRTALAAWRARHFLLLPPGGPPPSGNPPSPPAGSGGKRKYARRRRLDLSHRRLSVLHCGASDASASLTLSSAALVASSVLLLSSSLGRCSPASASNGLSRSWSVLFPSNPSAYRSQTSASGVTPPRSPSRTASGSALRRSSTTPSGASYRRA